MPVIIDTMYDAIFFPVLGRKLVASIVIAASLGILATLFIPIHPEFALRVRTIPDAISLARHSLFPANFAVAYSLAVYLGIGCAFLTAFGRGDFAAFQSVRARQCLLSLMAADALFAALIWAFLTTVMSPVSVRADSVFVSISQHRFAAVLWVEGVFGLIYVGTLSILFRLSHILRKLCKSAPRKP